MANNEQRGVSSKRVEPSQHGSGRGMSSRRVEANQAGSGRMSTRRVEPNEHGSGRMSSRRVEPIQPGSSRQVVASNAAQQPRAAVPNRWGQLRTYQVTNEFGVVVGHFADQIPIGEVVPFGVYYLNKRVAAFNVGHHDLSGLIFADGPVLADLPADGERVIEYSYDDIRNQPAHHLQIRNQAGTAVGAISDHFDRAPRPNRRGLFRVFSIFNQEDNFEDQVKFKYF